MPEPPALEYIPVTYCLALGIVSKVVTQFATQTVTQGEHVKVPSYLNRRGKNGIYHVRLRVPKDLIGVFRRAEFNKSLGTSDLRLAAKLARPILEQWEGAFERARRKPDLNLSDLNAAAREHYERALYDDEERRVGLPSPSQVEQQKAEAIRQLRDAARKGQFDPEDDLAFLTHAMDYPALLDCDDWDRETLEIRLDELRGHLGIGETVLVDHIAEEFLDRHGLSLDKTSSMYRQLCRNLLRAEIQHLERVRERNSGDYSGRPTDELFRGEGPKRFSTVCFNEIIDEQQRLSSKGIGRRAAASTIRKYRNCVRQFAEWRSSDRVATVTKAEVERWRDELLETNARKTVRDKISTIRTVLEWGQKQSDGKLFLKRFPLDTIELPMVEHGDSSARTYTMHATRKILSEARGQSAAYKRWVPWILAYSGARVEEVMQLEKADFFKYDDHWFFHIRAGEGRTTKTGIGRKVPVHSALVQEGLLDFVASLPDGKLFTGSRASQNLRDWIREEVLKDHPEPKPAPNHGFRHLFEDLRRARLDTEAANYITGRANKGSAETYGKSNIMLPALAAEMEKIPRIL